MAEAAAITLVAASTLMSANNQIQAGKAARTAAEAQAQGLEYQSSLLDQRAGQERASSQRDLLQERRKERLIQSALQARAAASGGGALDPTVADLSENIAAEGDYRARTALYKGEDTARGYENQAVLRRYEASESRRAGDAAKAAAKRQAIATILGGAAQGAGMYWKYGGGGPSKTNDLTDIYGSGGDY